MPANGALPSRFSSMRRLFHEDADFPVARVISQRNRLPVRSPQPALRTQDEKWIASDLGRRPAHAGILNQPEQITRRPFTQHLVRKRQRPHRPLGLGGHRVNRWIFRVEQ